MSIKKIFTEGREELAIVRKYVGKLGKDAPDNMFDEEELKKGIEVELEHTTNREIAKIIAKDHLMEDPKYYTKLEKIDPH